MAAPMAISIHAARLEQALEAAPERMRAGLRDALTRAGIAHENIIKRNRFGPYRGSSYADRLQRRSGALARAYMMKPPASGGELEMTAAIRKGLPGSQYAKAQEFGATIKPKRAKFLTIPLPVALTPAGVLKGKYRIRRSGSSASGYTTDAGDTFLFKSKRGNLVIGIKKRKTVFSSGVAIGQTETAMSRGRGRNREIEPVYVLKRSVTLKPRLGFFASWERLERSTLPVLVNRAAGRILAEGTRG